MQSSLKRTTIFLTKEQHEHLRRIAFERWFGVGENRA